MVVEYGMSPRLGPLSFGHDGFRGRNGSPLFPGERPEVSDETARIVDEEVTRMLNEAHDKAKVILERDRELLDKLSDVLIEREVIDGKELKAYVDGTEAIPTRDELQQETKERAASENGQRKAGPDLIASAPPRDLPTPPIPARPD